MPRRRKRTNRKNRSRGNSKQHEARKVECTGKRPLNKHCRAPVPIANENTLFLFVKAEIPIFRSAMLYDMRRATKMDDDTIYVRKYTVVADSRFHVLCKSIHAANAHFLETTTGTLYDRVKVSFHDTFLRTLDGLKSTAPGIVGDVRKIFDFIWNDGFVSRKKELRRMQIVDPLSSYGSVIVSRIANHCRNILIRRFSGILVFNNTWTEIRSGTVDDVRVAIQSFLTNIVHDEFRHVDTPCQVCNKNTYDSKKRCGFCRRIVCNRCRICSAHPSSMVI